jgi:dihydrofolate synthase/folylpolyglutamate synthase
MYQRDGKAAYKADLHNTIKLATYLKNPHLKIKTIHVAGTNGKGSTSHMLASVLQEAGYKVGLYTSPHLKDFRERIKINGEMIPKRTVSAFVKKNKPFFEVNQLSFFEMTVGMAFDYFSNSKVDIAVIEVGMGGRLDSTNIITPEVSVITNIGLDHTQFLGTTTTKIAREKAGIIKPDVPVVIGETMNGYPAGEVNTRDVFNEVAKNHNAKIIFAENLDASPYESDLKGNYQKKNIRTVLATLDILRNLDWNISELNIKKGLKQTVSNTGLMGRWQILHQKPMVICDTAHNKEGLTMVIEQIMAEKFNRLHIVMGFVADKDLNSLLPLLPADALYYFCEPAISRGLNVRVLQTQAKRFNLIGEAYLSVKMAYKDALFNAAKEDLVFIGGSNFVVAEVL